MKLLEGQTVGIDLGTTYSSVAQLNESGVPVSLKNADGETSTASVVLLGEGGQIQIGPPDARLAVEDPTRIVQAVKREMGNSSFYKIYQNKKLTPEFLSALILKKLVQDAGQQIGAVVNAVITVPYYFNDICRKATQDAGRIAGLNVIDILNEPTAATLAYAWIKGELGRPDLNSQEKTIMVYDLGGGTFDVTLVKYTPTHFRVVATDGDVRLGGLDWSRRVVEHVSTQFQQRFGIDPLLDPEMNLRLTQACEAAKRALSTTTAVPIHFSHKGKNLTISLTRADFERMTGDLLQRTRDTFEFVLQEGNAKPQELDEVLLVGGSTHMPAVGRMLTDVCGRSPSRALDPEVAVAQGAAIHAAILEARATGQTGRMAQAVLKRLRAVTTQDVNSHSLGVEVTDLQNPEKKRNHVMIPRNTPVPNRVVQRFVTTVSNPRAIHVRLLEGEASDVDACTLIGDFRVIGLPANLPAGSPVELAYSYDASGRIHAAAKELVGNTKATAEIVRESGLNDIGLEAFKTLAQGYRVE
jgi:molecular chaperone DnaK